MPVVLIYGDSLSAAYGIPREAGWVALLEKRLTQGGLAAWRVVNASVSGETTAGGLTRLPGILAAHRPRIVILELGANDGLRGLPVAQTAENLEAMTRLVQKGGAAPLLVGMRVPPNYGSVYAEAFQALYPKVAKRTKVGLAPFLLEGMAQRRDQFQDDHLHPVAAAQSILLDNVWPALLPLLKATAP